MSHAISADNFDSIDIKCHSYDYTAISDTACIELMLDSGQKITMEGRFFLPETVNKRGFDYAQFALFEKIRKFNNARVRSISIFYSPILDCNILTVKLKRNFITQKIELCYMECDDVCISLDGEEVEL